MRVEWLKQKDVELRGESVVRVRVEDLKERGRKDREQWGNTIGEGVIT